MQNPEEKPLTPVQEELIACYGRLLKLRTAKTMLELSVRKSKRGFFVRFLFGESKEEVLLASLKKEIKLRDWEFKCNVEKNEISSPVAEDDVLSLKNAKNKKYIYDLNVKNKEDELSKLVNRVSVLTEANITEKEKEIIHLKNISYICEAQIYLAKLRQNTNDNVKEDYRNLIAHSELTSNHIKMVTDANTLKQQEIERLEKPGFFSAIGFAWIYSNRIAKLQEDIRLNDLCIQVLKKEKEVLDLKQQKMNEIPTIKDMLYSNAAVSFEEGLKRLQESQEARSPVGKSKHISSPTDQSLNNKAKEEDDEGSSLRPP